ncbi:P1 family peptidase [Kineosporia sp. R_H_3]|uniref:DmpA family aminopeptidase n=1 Tax=Kineosporia sp. R_H_3 TaxID=1961848 RepID=UPI0018E9D9EF|nr:P1 family peptidase [Kineosporia sp. R_H_3]
MTTTSSPASPAQPDPRTTAPDGRPRARGIGIPFPGEPGPLNAVTDVPGLEVGYVTLVEGDGPLVVGEGPVRTGVTAILPRGRDGVGVPCAAGWYSLNGNGEMTGTTWVEEVGALALPVVVSNTHAVGACHTGTVEWVARTHPAVAAEWLLPVVAETWDGYLNDINGGHVRPEHAVAALDGATSGPLAEGSVGGGTGMNCYSFKGGSGTASRVVAHGSSRYTVGAFVQANFGDRGELSVAGVRLGDRLADDDPMSDPAWLVRDVERAAARAPGAVRPPSAPSPASLPPGATRPPGGAGSVIVVVATDAPLLPGQCKALARRVPLGLARTGTSGGHFSGDIFLAFSTANAGALRSRIPVSAATDDDYDTLRFVPWGRMDPFFTAVVQCVEEAVLNALVVNADMVGRDGHRSPALPHGAVREALARAGVLAP